MSALITYFELAAFLASLFAWPAIRKSQYLRLFPLLLFVIVSVEIWLTFFKGSFSYYNAAVYNVQVPVQHLLYLIILYFAFEKVVFRKLMIVFSAIVVVTAITTSIFIIGENRSNTIAYCTGSILVITGILMKFHEMLQNPSDFNFLKSPFFYMLFAFLLFNVGTLPYFTMSNWLYYSLKRTDILLVLINVMSVFNYILYATYTIAFLWMTLKKESY